MSIRLPFEQAANPVIAGDDKFEISMKYFFTRKLMLIKESKGFISLPGGFGTIDETFELLTLTQTGKGLPVPIVLLDTPGDPYWEVLDEFIRGQLVRRGLVLWRATRACTSSPTTPPLRSAEIVSFYRNYESIRYVGDVARPAPALRSRRRRGSSSSTRKCSATLCADGRIERSEAMEIERRHDDHVELPRIRFAFTRHRSGDLRALIDALNTF